MSNKAPWPVRKGIFRSSGQSDFVPQRTPSPVVEMPNTPTPQPGRTSNPLSPLISIVESPLSPPQSPSPMTPSTPLSPSSPLSPTSPMSPMSPTSSVNKSIRQIPIEVQHEVNQQLSIANRRTSILNIFNKFLTQSDLFY